MIKKTPTPPAAVPRNSVPGQQTFTQAGIDSEIEAELPTNSTGAIGAVDLRGVLHDMNAAVFQSGDGATGPAGPAGPPGPAGPGTELKYLVGPPTTADLSPGQAGIFKDTTTDNIFWAVNDNGVIAILSGTTEPPPDGGGPPSVPSVTSISPTIGATLGGTAVTIIGTNFTGATDVTIGGVAATSVLVVNPTTVTAVTPSHALGVVDVAVTAPGGMGTGTGLYTYDNTYYVDAVTGAGSNSNPGSQASPWATATHAFSTVPSGSAINLKMPGGSWSIAPPCQNLKALFIGQQGPNSGLLYDVANGGHGTLHGCTWAPGSVLNNGTHVPSLLLNGTSDYVELPAPLIGNSDFITYAVTDSNQGNQSQTGAEFGCLWQENLTTDPSGSYEGAALYYRYQGTIYDGSASGATVTSPIISDPMETLGTHSTSWLGRSGSTGYSGIGELYSFNSTGLGGVNISVDRSTIGVRPTVSSMGYYYLGAIAAIAIYTGYPNQTVFTSQYEGIASLLTSINFTMPLSASDPDFDPASLTPGPVWVRQGYVLGGPSNIGGMYHGGEPVCFYEGNPQILTGNTNVFKLWFTGQFTSGGHIGICYGESTDGINFTLHPSLLVGLSNGDGTLGQESSVIKIGSTYYLWLPSHDYSQLLSFTSTDGINFTSYSTTGLTKGALGEPDGGGFGNTQVVIENGIWYMFYEAIQNNLSGAIIGYTLNMATSPDGINWTKNLSNPINAFDLRSSSGPMGALEIGGFYYLWQHTPAADNSSICRTKFKKLGDYPQRCPYDYTFTKGTSGIGEGDQVADAHLVEANGKTYMYYGAVETGQSMMSLKLAIANMTIAQLITTTEGMTSTSP